MPTGERPAPPAEPLGAAGDGGRKGIVQSGALAALRWTKLDERVSAPPAPSDESRRAAGGAPEDAEVAAAPYEASRTWSFFPFWPAGDAGSVSREPSDGHGVVTPGID